MRGGAQRTAVEQSDPVGLGPEGSHHPGEDNVTFWSWEHPWECLLSTLLHSGEAHALSPFPQELIHPSKGAGWEAEMSNAQASPLPTYQVCRMQSLTELPGLGQGWLAGQAGGQNHALRSPRLIPWEVGGQVGHAALEKEVKQPSGIAGALTPSPGLPLVRRRVGRRERSGRGKPGGRKARFNCEIWDRF